MTLYDLLDEVTEFNQPAEWVDKMVHRIPPAPVFDRADYLVKACRNKVVLDVGASGPMSFKVQEVAKEYHGVGITANPGLKNYHKADLERIESLPHIPDLDIVIAGEILEHLSNAGRFLDLLYDMMTQVIITTPNAFSAGGRQYLAKGIEAVNGEHVAWYSYQTLKTLVERHGFKILLWAWYNGKPITAEGLIFHMEPNNGKD